MKKEKLERMIDELFDHKKHGMCDGFPRPYCGVMRCESFEKSYQYLSEFVKKRNPDQKSLLKLVEACERESMKGRGTDERIQLYKLGLVAAEKAGLEDKRKEFAYAINISTLLQGFRDIIVKLKEYEETTEQYL